MGGEARPSYCLEAVSLPSPNEILQKFFFLIRKSFNLTSVLLLYIKVNQAVLEESAVN